MKIKFILFVFISVWLALLVRVFNLAIKEHNYYDKLSINNTIKHEKIAPIRGEILDRKYRPIAINELGFKIQIKPHMLLKKHKKEFFEEIDVLTKAFLSLKREKLIKEYKKKIHFITIII